MKFKYLTTSGVFDTRGKAVKRPMLELELFCGDKKLNAFGHIDSGADTTTLNIQYAEALGIKIDNTKKREILGIGNGRVTAFVSNLQFKIKGSDLVVEVPAWFVDSENVNILLGQEVFFDRFKIKFEKEQGIFELVEVKK